MKTVPTYEQLLDTVAQDNEQMWEFRRIRDVINYTKKKPLLRKEQYYDIRGKKRTRKLLREDGKGEFYTIKRNVRRIELDSIDGYTL